MNSSQRLYYRQALSDLDAFDFLNGKHPCHRLHYLQMFAEKLAKAYQYGKAMPATKSHTGFRRFLKSLGSEPKIWKELRFSRLEDFEKHLDEMNHLAIEIESLAPANAGRGRNPEYPWPPPPDPPAQCPAEFDFPLWTTLTTTERGQKFLVFLRAIARIFPQRF